MRNNGLQAIKYLIFIFILEFSVSFRSDAQPVTLPENFFTYTIEQNRNADPGYLFMFAGSLIPEPRGYLLIADNYGTPVYYKFLDYMSGTFSPQKNGLLSYIKDDGEEKKFMLMDSAYRVVDSVQMETYQLDTHDFIAMENGHFLVFGSELRIVDMSQVVEGGSPAATVEGTVIQELDATKKVVFEWNSFDHYKITDTYDDLTASFIEYVHPNTLEIDSDGNILLVSRAMNEVTKIDRQTGQIIWRLGGKNNEFDFADTTHLFSKPHDIRRLENGNLTIFDNGNSREPAYSRAAEYRMDEANRTIELVWEYDADKSIFSRWEGSTRRLPSGNTIIGYGGRISSPAAREVHPDGSIAFQLSFDDSSAGADRILKFPWKTTKFSPSLDSVKFGEWDGYTEKIFLLAVKNHSSETLEITSVALHGNEFFVDEDLPFTIPANDQRYMKVGFFPVGSAEGTVFADILTLNSDRDSTERIAIQVHLEGYYPDMTPPGVTITPDLDTIPNNTVFQITFSEPVRLAGDLELTDENAAGVIIFREEDENGPDVSAEITVNGEKTMIMISPLSLLENKKYYLAVKAALEDAHGNMILKKERTFTATAPERIPAKKEDLLFAAFPNPVENYLVVENRSAPEPYDLDVINVSGQTILKYPGIKGRIHTLDLSDLESGSYYLRIVGNPGDEWIMLKLIKK